MVEALPAHSGWHIPMDIAPGAQGFQVVPPITMGMGVVAKVGRFLQMALAYSMALKMGFFRGCEPHGRKYSYNRACLSPLHLNPDIMTTSYKDLLKQREALEQQINEARRSELSSAVAQVRSLVAEYGLTAQDVFPAGKSAGKGTRSSTAGTKVAPKYRNPATGETWTGRGKAPKWIQNESREKFVI